MKNSLFLASILAVLLGACSFAQGSRSEFSTEDQMFAVMMIPHHEQAIELSDLALLSSADPVIKALAAEIRAAQAPEIAQLKSWGLSDTGSQMGHVMDGMLSDDEMQKLAAVKGSEFDRLFLEGMIKHHQGAIEMAGMVLESKNAVAATLGRSIVETQAAEIEKMRLLLKR